MSTVKKPILLDETGKEIAAHMRTQNALLSTIVRGSIDTFTSWKNIQAIVKQGLAPEIFHVGDQFIVPWIDVVTGNKYDVPLDIVHFGNAELKGGEVVPAMFLQWHYATPFDIQFDAPEKEVAKGMFSAEYSYYIADGDNYKYLTPGADYSTGTEIPTDTVYYRSAIRDLSGKICKYGYNRWSHSAIRQFLNSNAKQGAWWVAQHPGDMPPDKPTAHAGFMTGFEEDFLSCLNPIKVTTACNTATDGGAIDTTYDTFFIPSLEQIYVKSQVAGVEGDYFEYWKRATGATAPNEPYGPGANPAYLVYAINAKTTTCGAGLRSTSRDISCNIWWMATYGENGYIGNNKAFGSMRYTPVCAIC